MVKLGWVGAVLLVAVGCGGSDDPEQQVGNETGKSAVTLSFSADWDETQSGPLVEGKRVDVDYDVERLPDCRGDQNGHPGWTITGNYMIDGEEARTFWAGGFSPSGPSATSSFKLDGSGDLELWFEITSVWGCHGYDSDYGHNSHFEVEPR